MPSLGLPLLSPQGMLDEIDPLILGYNYECEKQIQTAFTRCRHILKTVKNLTDRPSVHTKTAHFLPADFENGRF